MHVRVLSIEVTIVLKTNSMVNRLKKVESVTKIVAIPSEVSDSR